jgi:hypothetical protein
MRIPVQKNSFARSLQTNDLTERIFSNTDDIGWPSGINQRFLRESGKRDAIAHS